jgi:hypothetical protein
VRIESPDSIRSPARDAVCLVAGRSAEDLAEDLLAPRRRSAARHRLDLGDHPI